MRYSEIVGESATSGATASGNIATLVGGKHYDTTGTIGVGFANPKTADWGVYSNPHKRKSKKKKKK